MTPGSSGGRVCGVELLHLITNSSIFGNHRSGSPPLEQVQLQLKRVLGRADLVFFLIAAEVNLNSVPVVAGSGPTAFLFWIAAFLLFFIPQGIAVLELSRRFPQEGGIYRWNKTAFGDFHGFVSGWTYWTNNMFYIPTLLFYIVGFSTFIGGRHTAGLGDNPLFMAGVSLVLLWFITWLNIRGFGVGKWVQTIGASGTFVTTAIILAIGYVAISTHGMATPIEAASLVPAWGEWRVYSLFGAVCLNYVGLELASVIGDEVKDPHRNIPHAVIIAGVATVVLYLTATFALQATIPAAEIGVIDGILQGVQHAAEGIGWTWIVVPIAMLMILNAGGNASAWLAGSSRIPFVIGIDRYLPASFGRIHPRHRTPHVALIVQSLASSLFIIINAIGSSVYDMYMILLQTTIILTLIPYLYMFAALVRIRRSPARFGAGAGFFERSWICYVAGIVGLAVTLFGLVFAFSPSPGIEDILGFEFKLLLGTLGFLVPAVLIYRWSISRRKGPHPMALEPVED
jgi:amino acid transporter